MTKPTKLQMREILAKHLIKMWDDKKKANADVQAAKRNEERLKQSEEEFYNR